MRLLHTLLILLLIHICHSTRAQIIWTEDFSVGGAAIGTLANGYPGLSGGTWTQTNDVLGFGEGSAANQWYVSGEECGNSPSMCGSVCSNIDASLHVSAIGGLCGIPDCGAAYDATNNTNITDKRIESPSINTTSYGGLTLSFNYIAAQEDDFVRVSYSCDGGTTWTNFAPLPSTLCCGIFGGTGSCTGFFNFQGVWTNYSYVLPVCCENNPNVKIAFHWINDGDGIGTDPSIAIDDIQISATTILPIEIVSFTGENRGREHLLKWSTVTEHNASHFQIERSTDGLSFATLGSVNAIGESSSLINYLFLIEHPLDGVSLYRLKEFDFDGQWMISELISIASYTEGISELKVYPNPFHSSLTLTFNAPFSGNCTLEILDVSGRIVLQSIEKFKYGKNEIVLETAHLQNGHYLVNIVANGSKITRSIVK